MIKDELIRIINAKNEIAKAITDKGIDVPDDALIDTYPDLISKISSGGSGRWHSDNPLHFSISVASDNKLTLGSRLVGLEISYDGKTWTPYAGGTIMMNARTIPDVYVRSAFLSYAASGAIYTDPSINVEGNVESLLEGSEGKLYGYCLFYAFSGCKGGMSGIELPDVDTIPTYAYAYTFNGCSGITVAPKITASEVNAYGLAYTFNGCSNLLTSPDINFSKIDSYGCSCMFNDCSKLQEVPFTEGASEVGEKGCYRMFYGCSAIDTRPNTILATTTALGANGYEGMFQGCSSLTSAPNIEVVGANASAFSMMFYGCSAMTKAPTKLEVDSRGKSSLFNSMFRGCTSLTETPVIKITTITTNLTLSNMFYGCSKLNKIYISAESWNTSYASNWVNGVAATGEFHKNPGVTIPTGTGGVPSGWTVIEDLE